MTTDAGTYQLGRQGQTGHLRGQAGVELWTGGQLAADGQRAYQGFFPKAYAGLGLSLLSAESGINFYVLGNGGYGGSFIQGYDHTKPLKTPHGWPFLEGGAGAEINIAEVVKIFFEGKYTHTFGDNLDGINLSDGRSDATFGAQVGLRYIIP